MTRLWLPAEPITVSLGENTSPIYFVWRGTRYTIDAVLMRWRADSDWWERRQWHEYFLLSTHTGQLVIVYRDLITLNWFFQRLYD